MLPVYGVSDKSGQYMRATLANAELLNASANVRAAAASYERVNRAFETDTYDCLEYGLEAPVDDSYARDCREVF